MPGQAPPVYGSEPAAPSRAEAAFVQNALDAHLALCYSDPGRAEAVERDWVCSVDRIEARASGGDAPEDARNYVEALRTEQEAQLPGWELARFVSRAHTAVGLPVVELARTGDKVVPAFSPATIERLGESYPDLHAAVRTMDPASPLAHPGPQDDPRYVAELNPQWTGQIRPFVDTANPAISGAPRRELISTSGRRSSARLSGPWCASFGVRT